MKFVDIKNDIAFRKNFGNENKKEVLISFLNAVLFLENDKKIISVDHFNTLLITCPKRREIYNCGFESKRSK